MTEEEARGGEFESVNSETLVKPSEILTKESEKDDQSKFFEEEHVVKPSERLKEVPIAEIPGEDRLVRPSEVLKKDRTPPSEGVKAVTLQKESFNKVQSTVSKIEQKTETDEEGDTEYKKRVRETLEEVVNLLERLME